MKAWMAALAAAGLWVMPCGAAFDDFDAESREEPAGASFGVALNTQDDVYGIVFGSGLWLRDTPVFGNYELDLFSSRIEDAWYSGFGLTLRLMPHTTVAPFAGGGGSYNLTLTEEQDGDFEPPPGKDEPLPDRGESYWAYHAEAGIRFWVPSVVQLVELCGRYTWSALDGDRDYWMVIVSTGTGF